MVKIAIPSYKRSDDQVTLDFLPKSYKENIFLFIRKEEYNDYSKYENKCNIVTMDNVKDIGETRQFIIEYMNGSKLLMLDDDLHIAETYIDAKDIIRNNKIPLNESKFYEFIDYLDKEMDEFYHGNLRIHIFPKNVKSDYPARVNSFCFTNGFFNLEKLKLEDINFKELDLCEDLYVFLSLIKLGYDALSISKYRCEGKKSNAAGGCSEYRTIEKQNRAYEKINELFPESTFFFKRKKDNSNFPGQEKLKGLTIRVKSTCHISKYKGKS